MNLKIRLRIAIDSVLFWLVWKTPPIIIYVAGLRILQHSANKRLSRMVSLSDIGAREALDVWGVDNGFLHESRLNK